MRAYRLAWAFLGLALLFPILAFCLDVVAGPDISDSSVFRYVGLTMSKGGHCYVDVWDHKGPLIFFFNALGYWLAPWSNLGPSFVFMCVWLGIILLIFDAFRRIWNSAPIALGLTFCMLAAFGAECGRFYNCVEGLALFFAALGIWCGFRLPYKMGALCVGLCTGLAMMVKPNLIAFAGAFAVFWLLEGIQTRGWRRLSWRATLSFAGFIGALGLVAVMFLPDRLPFLLDATFGYNLFEYKQSDLSWFAWWKEYLLSIRLSSPGGRNLPLNLMLLVPACYGYFILRKQQNTLATFLLLWMIFEIGAAVIAKSFYSHYWIGVYCPCGLLCAQIFFCTTRTRFAAIGRFALMIGVLFIAVLFGYRYSLGFKRAYLSQESQMYSWCDKHDIREKPVAVWGGFTSTQLLGFQRLELRQRYFLHSAYFPFASVERRQAMVDEFCSALNNPEIELLLLDTKKQQLEAKLLPYPEALNAFQKWEEVARVGDVSVYERAQHSLLEDTRPYPAYE